MENQNKLFKETLIKIMGDTLFDADLAQKAILAQELRKAYSINDLI